MQLDNIGKFDSQGMFEIIKSFPSQVKEAIEIGKSCKSFRTLDRPIEIIVLGMGGSAIGGDLLKSYCAAVEGAKHLKITVNRHYNIPEFIGDHTFIIASSYSGDTEETLSALSQARSKTDNIVCLSSGGKLSQFAQEFGYPLISIPSGLQPRAALGYSFFPMLFLLIKSGAFDKSEINTQLMAISECLDNLTAKSSTYSLIDENNYSIQLASKLYQKVAIIYSSSDRLDAVNTRWRCQIQENAKQAAFGNLLPEMNHNEINGFSYPSDFKSSVEVIFMQDKDTHERIAKRFNALGNIFRKQEINPIELQGDGNSLLTRIFDLVYLGDWVSYYLSQLNGTDPTPIPLIRDLKEYMSES